MKITASAFIAAVLICISNLAHAASFDIGARYGRTVEQDGNTFELAARYLPVPFLSLGASFGYANLRYDKGWYYKKADTMPLGGYVNARLPLPLITPYAGFGGILYSVNNTTSPNPADKGREHSGTATVQGGVDISMPLPKLSLNIEARRLISDRQTQVLGGFWLRF